MHTLLQWRMSGRMVLAVAVARELPIAFVWVGSKCFSWTRRGMLHRYWPADGRFDADVKSAWRTLTAK